MGEATLFVFFNEIIFESQVEKYENHKRWEYPKQGKIQM